MARLLAILGLLPLFAMSANAPATPDGDVAQLRQLERTFATAMNDKDADAVMAVYANEKSFFVFDVVGPPGVHVGWDEYYQAFKRMFGSIDGPLRFSVSDLDVQVSGDVGYGRSLQHLSGIHIKGKKPFDYTVRVTDVYRKGGGKWLIVQEHISLPVDRETFMPILHSSLPK